MVEFEVGQPPASRLLYGLASSFSFRRVYNFNFRLVETSLDAADTSVCATSPEPLL